MTNRQFVRSIYPDAVCKGYRSLHGDMRYLIILKPTAEMFGDLTSPGYGWLMVRTVIRNRTKAPR